MSSGLERTEAYRIRGENNFFRSKYRSKSTMCGLLIRCINFLLTKKMYYLQGAGLLTVLVAALYMTRQVMSEHDFQTITSRVKSQSAGKKV